MTIHFQLHPKKRHIAWNIKNESDSAVHWFRNNNMIVNPDKFQLRLLQKSKTKVIRKNSKSIKTKLNLRIRWLFYVLLLTISNHLMTIFQNYVTKHRWNWTLYSDWRNTWAKKSWKLFLTVFNITISITAALCGTLVLTNLMKKLKTYISVVLD